MKKKVFSGIQPSGNLHIGNYLGAILTWVREQDEKENTFCIVNEHAITVPQDSKKLKEKTIELAKIYLAAGIDPKKSNIFVQSSRSEHTQLGWILNCFLGFGELNRMTQFKDKTNKNEVTEEIAKIITKTKWVQLKDPVESYYRLKKVEEEYFDKYSMGLLDYPALMAADILLYDTNEVPVGEDQKQHVELTRDIAERMNKKFGPIFTVPEYYTISESTRIMSLTDPTVKMSKSDENEGSRIEILDTPEEIRKKFARAVTDSGTEIIFDKDKKPGISNLLNILSVITSTSIKDLEKKYKGVSYGQFKSDVAEATIKLLSPFQEKYHSISDKEVEKILIEGSQKVAPTAKKTLKRVKDAVGLIDF